LSSYDDLIENNRQRIQLLERSARLLYKEWFVHLRFPGHEHVKITDGIPEGWEKTTAFTNGSSERRTEDESGGILGWRYPVLHAMIQRISRTYCD
jgi:restriction endonuclease S subunit